jgi:hypothetical protein
MQEKLFERMNPISHSSQPHSVGIPSLSTSISSNPSISTAGSTLSDPSTVLLEAASGVPLQPKGETLKNLSAEKLISFTVGPTKKSRFQKAREVEEAKRKQQEEETAKVYETFVSSFNDQDDEEDEGDGNGRQKRFIPSGKSKKNSEMDRLMEEMKVSFSFFIFTFSSVLVSVGLVLYALGNFCTII